MALTITVFSLAALTACSLLVLPAWLLLRAESAYLKRLFRQRGSAAATESGWRGRLRRIATGLSALNTIVGRLAAWLLLLMLLTQFAIVMMRYVFSFGVIQMQESVWYLHAIAFMLGAAYTMANDRHVRLDLFYRSASVTTQAWINLIGAAAALFPFCIAMFIYAWPFVVKSWAVREGSAETMGLPGIYLLKTVILIFLALLGAQSICLAIKSILTLARSTETSNPGRAGRC